MVDRAHRTGDQGGFSLVELLVVMLIAGVLGAAIVTAVVSAGRAERVALDLRENTDAARLATERLRDEIRTAWGVCNSSDETTLTIWWRDENENGRINAEELRHYAIVGGELLRSTVDLDNQLLATGLGDGSRFSYLKSDGNQVVAPLGDNALDCDSTEQIEGRGDIATVGVILEGERSGGRVQPTRVETRITLRNAAIADGSINPNRPPLALFSQSCSGTTCTFDARASHDEDGLIVAHNWDFGDGATGEGDFVIHTFSTASTFQIQLTVRDDGGATATAAQFVDLADGQVVPSASFTVACAGLTCSFDPDASYHSAGTIDSYAWSFGDNSDIVSETSSALVSHTYAASGSYTVTLEVRDTAGNVGTANKTANPTADTTGVRLELEDVSTTQNANHWNAAVSIKVLFANGTPVVGVNVAGRFGPDETSLGNLWTQRTNAEGTVTLQANGNQSSDFYFFQVESISDHELSSASPRTLQLQRPV